jgi:hypothetical protein
LKKLPAERVILDGEIAALDEKGRSSFQLLQMFKSFGDVPLVYYVFDLLFLEGKDLRDQPLSTRRKLLAQVLKKPPENIRLSDELAAAKMSCSGSPNNFASRGWSPNAQIQFTKAAGAAVPGSNSRSPNPRSSLSAVTRSRKETGNILVPCWPANKVPTGSCSPGESELAFPKNSWRTSMHDCKS